jgi:hypothetical protein
LHDEAHCGLLPCTAAWRGQKGQFIDGHPPNRVTAVW